jgi:hypothetical protein
MPPVRIKYYGLVWLTRRGYLRATALLAAVAVLVCVTVLLWTGQVPFAQPPWEPALRRYGFVAWFWNWWTLGALVLAEGLEVLLTLRQFARREAEQRAHPEPPADPGRSGPPGGGG